MGVWGYEAQWGGIGGYKESKNWFIYINNIYKQYIKIDTAYIKTIYINL
jgi:hypothetical protein